MNTNLFSLSRGAESVHHTYHIVPPFDKKPQPKAEDSSRPLPSTRLQRARLTAQEISQPFFEKVKFLLNRDADHLKGIRFSPWAVVAHTPLTDIVQKVAQFKNHHLLKPVQDEKLQTCWKNLQDGFDQFYLKIVQERNSVKKMG